MKVRRWLPPLLWAGVILLATSIPGEVIPPKAARYDKIIHFIVYGIFAALLTRAIAAGRNRWQSVILAIVGACVLGSIDEWHQQFVPGRMNDLRDFGADAVGAAIGALLVGVTQRARTPAVPK